MNVRLDIGLILLGGVFAASGIQRARAASSDLLLPPVRAAMTEQVLRSANADSLEDHAATIVANDPFRLSNAPPTTRFSATSPGGVPAPVVRPVLTLRAIVGGPPWSALVEGMPGQAGAIVVSPGTTYDKLRVRTITRDTVIVQAPDTVWKLTLKGGA